MGFLKIKIAKSYREAFTLRAKYQGLQGVADRATPEQTLFTIKRVLSHLNLKKTDCLLDIGTGDGTLLSQVSSQVAHCTGIDICEDAISLLKKHLQQHKNIDYLVGFSDNLPCKDNSFSIVIINSVFYALSSYEEAEKSIQEISRVIQSKGIAFFGEIPMVNERSINNSSSNNNSTLIAAITKIREFGIKGTISLLKRMRKKKVQIIAPNSFLCWSENDFTTLLRKHNFKIKKIVPHITEGGLTSRLHYIAERI